MLITTAFFEKVHGLLKKNFFILDYEKLQVLYQKKKTMDQNKNDCQIDTFTSVATETTILFPFIVYNDGFVALCFIMSVLLQ